MLKKYDSTGMHNITIFQAANVCCFYAQTIFFLL